MGAVVWLLVGAAVGAAVGWFARGTTDGGELDAVQRRLEELERERDKLREERDEARWEASEAMDEAEAASDPGVMQGLKERIAILEKELEAARAPSEDDAPAASDSSGDDARVQELTDERDALKAEIEQLQVGNAELEEMRGDLVAAHAELDRIREKLAQAERDRDSFEAASMDMTDAPEPASLDVLPVGDGVASVSVGMPSGPDDDGDSDLAVSTQPAGGTEPADIIETTRNEAMLDEESPAAAAAAAVKIPAAPPAQKPPAEEPPAEVSEPSNGLPSGLLSDAPSETDDLKVIKGVGPALERQLNEAGVYRLDQLAGLDDSALSYIAEHHARLHGKLVRGDFVGQARALTQA